MPALGCSDTALRRDECQPQPVKRVEIPKPDGGIRKLGVPCVIDRLIQQANYSLYWRRGRCLAFENDIPSIVPFGDHADDLVAVHHNQRSNVFFSHFRDGVIDRGVRVNGVSFPTFLVEQLPHGGHLDPASATPPGAIFITIHQIRLDSHQSCATGDHFRSRAVQAISATLGRKNELAKKYHYMPMKLLAPQKKLDAHERE